MIDQASAFFPRGLGAVAAGEEFEVRLYGWNGNNNVSNHHITGGFVNGTVPEPATMSLLALGGLGILRKRRKQ